MVAYTEEDEDRKDARNAELAAKSEPAAGSLPASWDEIIRHSLGASHPDSPLGWRNYYATEPDDPQMVEIMAAGLMRRGRDIPGGLVYYHVTDAGKAAVGL